MKRLFTFLMTTLVLLVVSTQGLRAEASVYLQTGQIVNGVQGAYNAASTNISAHKFTYVSGTTYKFDVQSCNQTDFYFRIYVANWDNRHIAPSANNTPISISEEGSTPVSVDWVHAGSTNNSWQLDYSKASGYEYLTIYVDVSNENNKVWVVGKAKSSVEYILNIDGVVSSEKYNGKFSLDLTSETDNRAISFTINGNDYGMDKAATVSAAGTTTYTFASDKTNALTLSKGLSYTLKLNPNNTTTSSTAASAYTLTVEATTPKYDDYYIIGRIYGAGSTWSDENEDGMKFTTTDGKIYTRSVLCTTNNDDFSFRLGFDNGQYRPNESCFKFDRTSGKVKSEMSKRDASDNNTKDFYWNANMEAGNLYTFTLDLTDSNNPTLSLASKAVSGKYEMVATSEATGKQLILSLSQARIRYDKGEVEKGYAPGLWSVGFKDDLLDGSKGDVYDVYIRDTKAHEVQFRPAVATSGYGNFDKAMGSSRVDELNLDFTNLKYFGNAVYADPTSGSTNTFNIKKGDGKSYMLMLNLGGVYDESANGKNSVSFEHKATSVSMFVYGSLSETYKNMYENKCKLGTYDEKTQDFYLIGQIYQEGYSSEQIASGTNSNKMVRQIYYNPITNDVDSIVYSKIVKRPSDASSYNGIFLSFVPAFFSKTTLYSNGSLAAGSSSTSDTNAWNYIARAATFDEKDATAPFGTVMVRGKDENKLRQNGNQAINPILSPEDKNKAYYIVRFNVTTSTYRIEFVNEPELYVGRLQTFCNTNNLKLGTGMHAYAVQTLKDIKEGDTNDKVQGTLELRSLKYIPANEGVVLYVENAQFTGSNYDAKKDSLKYKFEVLSDADVDEYNNPILTETKEKWWNTAYSDTYHNCLVASLFGTTIENGTYIINTQGKYEYQTRNFALNKFFNTKYYKGLSAEEQAKYSEEDNYWGFFRAKGKVRAGRAYLRLTKDELNFNGQFLDNKEDDTANFAKMSLFFDDLGGDITGIQEVNTNVTPREDGAYYTLQGMKVEKPVKGLYIHNGKKVIIK